MQEVELESVAEEVRRRAHVASTELPLASEIAVRLLGARGFAFGHPAAGARLIGNRIIVPPNHPDLNFVIGHELGEWALRELVGYRDRGPEKEAAANYIAAAIIAPREAVRAAHKQYGERIAKLARAFVMSQTAMFLRLAEVLSDERAVLTVSGNVLSRGTALRLVSLREAARYVARYPAKLPGVARARLRGGIDEGRIAFRWR